MFKMWAERAREAKDYFITTKPNFVVRDDNALFSLQLRHGLLATPIPPSHAEIVPETATSTKQYNEILNRLVSILTAKYPIWIFHPDGLSPTAGLRAAKLSTFARSLWLTLEDLTGVPVHRIFSDEQLSKGGAFYKVHMRLDRWQNLPYREEGESQRDFDFRVKQYKMLNPPFDIIVPEYDTVYYDLTVEGLTRLVESKRISALDAADQFGGYYSADRKLLTIPVEVPAYDKAGMPMYMGPDGPTTEWSEGCEEMMATHSLEFKASTGAEELNYMEYWVKGQGCVYLINETPIRYAHMEPGDEIPYFLGLGEITCSPDPGRMGLPILYNAFEDFVRQLGFTAMEYAFLWKHGFARLVKTEIDIGNPASEEPDLPDQEDEEEVIGELLKIRQGEKWEYLVPANVSVLFADAKRDVQLSIDKVALADILTGQMPPSGTTGFLISQLASAAVSKYVPLLHQQARAIRSATLYILKRIDAKFQSEVTVPVQQDEATTSPFVGYKPREGRGNRNLEVRISAPLPSDRIAKTQWLATGHQAGYVSQERVQREGYEIEQPELENEKIRIERFQKFIEPIQMLRAMQRSGQIDQVLEAARMGVLDPAIAQLAESFAAGPEGLVPGGNPNGVIQPQPGLGEPGVPTVGATVNARGGGTGGRAPGAERQPANQPPPVTTPFSPSLPGGSGG